MRTLCKERTRVIRTLACVLSMILVFNMGLLNVTNADVNEDGVIDEADLLMIKKYIVEWDIKLGSDIYSVSFYDGDRVIDVLFANEDAALEELTFGSFAQMDMSPDLSFDIVRTSGNIGQNDAVYLDVKDSHGFGTKSIQYTTEKLKGNCQFTVDERYFILRIVL